ncbi:hypothetical protein EDD22DRAFT_845979 [Suillus occidentalis]|nr:hypothetical protein EDD22DRAFT_845979 [Suillus occidentalis]
MPQHQGLPESNTNEFDSKSSSGSNSDDLDEELAQELCQALKVTQKLLLNLHGKYWETMKRNALLEAATSKAKEDTIRALGRKYSITQCLWINIKIFLLRTCPVIDLNSKECWIGGVAIEDGVKAELFQFISAEKHELMNYNSFGSQFRRGVGNTRSEMASDIKVMLSLKWLQMSSPHGNYTKFAPVLFPTSERPVLNEMLKSTKLVLKVSLFGKSSLAATGAASSRTKAKIWKLWATMLELTEIGETTKIPYHDYHNFFCQRLLTGGP